MSVSAINPTPTPSREPLTPEARVAPQGNPGNPNLHAFADGDSGPSFRDVIDTINPLQHLPIINTLYRAITGDHEPGVASRLVGGTLFGGIIGLVASIADVVVEDSTGKAPGGHLMALFQDDAPARGATAVADAGAPPPEAKPAPAKLAQADTVAQPARSASVSEPDAPPLSVAELLASAAKQAPAAAPPSGPPPAVTVEPVNSLPAAPLHGPGDTTLSPLPRRGGGITADPKFMPTPNRAATRDSVSAASQALVTPEPAAVRRAMAQQKINAMPYAPAASPAATAATAPPPAIPPNAAMSNEWFATNFMQGMNKYAAKPGAVP